MMYPERFWDHSNAALQCAECTDKLCTQYCQKLRNGRGVACKLICNGEKSNNFWPAPTAKKRKRFYPFAPFLITKPMQALDGPGERP